MSRTEDLIETIQRAIKSCDDRQIGPYGALEAIASAIEDYHEAAEREETVHEST